jgi:hypothetical protein
MIYPKKIRENLLAVIHTNENTNQKKDNDY